MFIIGLDFAKVGSPFVKMVDVTFSQKCSLQVTHHCVKLGHTIADRRAVSNTLATIIL